MWKYFLVQFIYALPLLQRIISIQNCAILDFYNFKDNILIVEENSYVNLTFWLNTSSCNQSDGVYRIEVQTLTNVGSWEYDGRIIQLGNSCTEVTRVFAGCLTPEGPGRLYKKVDQSHVEIEWTWTWKDVESDEFTAASKRLNLQLAHEVRCDSLPTIFLTDHFVWDIDRGTFSASWNEWPVSGVGNPLFLENEVDHLHQIPKAYIPSYTTAGTSQ